MNVGAHQPYQVISSYDIKINEEESLRVSKVKTEEAQTGQKETGTQKEKNRENTTTNELTQGEQELVNKLSARDTEVRAHEAAHRAAGGALAGGASYSYQKGPDGRMYAVGGEVSISMKSGGTPEETIANARQIIAAAMAPASPSPQDYSVASSARMMEMKAQQQLTQQRQEEALGKETYTDVSNRSNQDSKTGTIDFSA